MKIIDIHAHLGSCNVFDLTVGEDELIRTMDENEIAASIVQPFPGAPDAGKVHDRIARLASKHPKRIFGLASLTPHVGEKKYIAEMERCINDLHFVGIKMHPPAYPVLPSSVAGVLIVETAVRLNVPLMIHTGAGMAFFPPSLSIPIAKKHPTLPIILTHGGSNVFATEAALAADECKNISLDSSWCGIPESKMLLHKVGADRIMFASDLPDNVFVELAKYRAMKLTDRQFKACMSETAMRIFKIVI